MHFKSNKALMWFLNYSVYWDLRSFISRYICLLIISFTYFLSLFIQYAVHSCIFNHSLAYSNNSITDSYAHPFVNCWWRQLYTFIQRSNLRSRLDDLDFKSASLHCTVRHFWLVYQIQRISRTNWKQFSSFE